MVEMKPDEAGYPKTIDGSLREYVKKKIDVAVAQGPDAADKEEEYSAYTYYFVIHNYFANEEISSTLCEVFYREVFDRLRDKHLRDENVELFHHYVSRCIETIQGHVAENRAQFDDDEVAVQFGLSMTLSPGDELFDKLCAGTRFVDPRNASVDKEEPTMLWAVLSREASSNDEG